MRGINIYYNAAGDPAFAHIDMRKYGKDLSSFFRKVNFSIENKPLTKKTKKKPLTGMMATQDAIKDVKNGNVIVCGNYNDYLKKTAKYA
ncbi:MAG: hypothetical protein LBF01_01125 [Bacteroidales bacterium]|jgi:hypothetical protein|nr:hypothetical protein [Bacteroidales bacterium]